MTKNPTAKSPVARSKNFSSATPSGVAKASHPTLPARQVPMSDEALLATLRVSEIRYRRLFEAARDGVLLLDPVAGKIVDANPFMTELLGYSHEEFMGKELWEIGLLKDEAASREMFRELQQNHYVRYENLPLKSTSGRISEVEVVANLYREDRQKIIQCNIRDITERKHAEAALRTSEQRFRALFETGPVAVYSCDRSGTIREYNRRAAELWGRRPLLGDENEKFCGSFKMHQQNGDSLSHDQCPMAAVLNGSQQSARDMEVVIERPDKSLITVLVNIVPLRNDRNEVTGAINCFYDITERKRNEHELMIANERIAQHARDLEVVVAERTVELRETINELEAFSYSVSHDMRAPLRSMRGFAELLLQNHSVQLNDEGRNYLSRISTAAARMDNLIHDVLTYTRVLHAEVKIVPVDLDALVREVIATYPQLHTGNVEIQILDVLPKALGAETSLAQGISNLLSNAVKFVAPETKPVVKIRAEEIGQNVRLWVEDNGIGIAAEDQTRIFNMFERVGTIAYRGTGMGLAIVRKAVERMGGQLGVESEAGHGSKFWIQLKGVTP